MVGNFSETSKKWWGKQGKFYSWMPEHIPKLLTSPSCQSELLALCVHKPWDSPWNGTLSMLYAGSAGSLGGAAHLCDCLRENKALNSVSACFVYYVLVTWVLDTSVLSQRAQRALPELPLTACEGRSWHPSSIPEHHVWRRNVPQRHQPPLEVLLAPEMGWKAQEQTSHQVKSYRDGVMVTKVCLEEMGGDNRTSLQPLKSVAKLRGRVFFIRTL